MALAGLTVFAVGCGQNGGGEAAKNDGKTEKVAPDGGKDDHSGWWCSEHGVPEHECSMCSQKAAKSFKAKNDWCEKHERAKSQCFICDPSLREKYAVQYRAKYGKEPPEPDGQKDKKDKK
jgi:hypothetical protein